MTETADPMSVPLRRLGAGELPPNVALMQLLMAARHPDEARLALAHAAASGPEEARAHYGRAARLLDANPEAHALVRRVLSRMDHEGREGAPETILARIAESYDAVAEVGPEASVALYTLGDPALLRAATAEVVERMRGWGLLGRNRTALEIGCGNGRFLEALAPELAHITGVDVSRRMVETARRRIRDLPNVRVHLTGGRDLGGFRRASFDLVLAADSFPYLVQADLAETFLTEIARVLRPGGDLLILNYSYRGDVRLDEADLLRICPPLGLDPVRRTAPGFAYWDAASFTFRRA